MAGKLTALKVKGLTRPGRYGDGGGLWLQVRDAERRSWLFRFTMHGRQRQMGLGSAQDIPLIEARERAQECRKLVRDGIDPIDRRSAERAARFDVRKTITFAEVVERYLKAHEASWRNDKHRWQWGQTLGLACKTFGGKPVAAVDTGDIMLVLEPIWSEKTETASRLRARIESVLDYAKARGWREGENPARWRGHLKNLLPAPHRIARVEHHPALPWSEIGAFMSKLRVQESVGARALEFTIMTAARTGEVIGARWPEIDLSSGIWVVPANRMKMGREHRVPLSDDAVAVLRKMQPLRQKADDFLFPGHRRGKPLSNMAMLMALRRLGPGHLTVHGFRSTFRDWAAEATNYPREVAEQALAHALPDKVEAAYRRGDLFEKRRRLMDDWAAFCARPTVPAGEIVALRRTA